MARKKYDRSDAARYELWTSDVEPAPGDLRFVQAFVNTQRFGKKAADELTSPQALADWLASLRLLPAETELDDADLERVLVVRKGLRALIRANRGVEVDAGVVGRLDRAVAAAPLVVRFAAGGAGSLEPAASGLDAALGRLAWAVVAAQLRGLWPRFQICLNSDCRRAFYDYSTNRSTKWCTVRCGNRMSARAARRRKQRA